MQKGRKKGSRAKKPQYDVPKASSEAYSWKRSRSQLLMPQAKEKEDHWLACMCHTTILVTRSHTRTKTPKSINPMRRGQTHNLH